MADFEPFAFDPSAFMSGQISSKLWLCEKLEPILNSRFNRGTVVWLLGGWYGMTSFLLQTRRNALIAQARSFDIDPQARRGALVLNETFNYQRTFEAELADVNTLNYEVDVAPDVVINTSTEHMDEDDWFSRIPKGTVCVVQSNNMPHDDHHIVCKDTAHLASMYPMSETLYLGAKTFHYLEWSFTRFMHIGVK